MSEDVSLISGQISHVTFFGQTESKWRFRKADGLERYLNLSHKARMPFARVSYSLDSF